ncbi:MAG TPA: carboxypeptidase M32 [Patescibacteria group bacterium]|nr:carboxypeptidase M32 [Patescibacteria group bacterium]
MTKLQEKYKEISLLSDIQAILSWDEEVNMPEKAAENRGEQTAFLVSLLADKWQDKTFQDLISKEKNKNTKRILERSLKIYNKIPKKLLIEESKLISESFTAWVEARKKKDFNIFAPYLEKLIYISRKKAKYLGYKNNPYDALLDLHEPGLTAEFVENLFSKLTPQLLEIIKNIKQTKKHTKFNMNINKQKEIAGFVLQKMGYDFNAGRMDVAPHPFETTLGRFDVRITNRYDEKSLESLTGAMHEGGHALYEQGADLKYENTPLDHGVSLGIHESQSRFWENMIGRSRQFCKYISSKYNLTPDEIYNLLNKVEKSFIRVDADEVTYNLHIAIRFEIENDLINGKIKVKDLPEVWNSKMKKYLGITPKNNSEGVLQDIHWAHNSFGYFPTYTLGNLYAGQWYYFLKKDIKNFDKLVESGNFKPILNWLRKNIHQYGSFYYPDELVKRVTGESLNPDYFVNYLKEKYES